MAVAGQFFGPGNELDAWLIAFLAPSFLSDAFAGALNPILVPLLVPGHRDPERASAYAPALYLSFALLTALAAALYLCASPALRLMASGFTPEKAALTRSLLALTLPILPLSAIAVTWRSVLNAHERFALAAVSPLMTPVVTICILAATARRVGVFALAAGTTAGMLAELTVLAFALRSLGVLPIPRWPRAFRWNRATTRQYCSVVAGNLVFGGSSLVDQAFAAMLAAGSVSVLGFGTRLPNVLLAIGSAALATAVFPRLSLLARRGDRAGFRRTLLGSIGWGTALTLPLIAALIWLSEPITRILFQRGAFTAAATASVSSVQQIALLQLPVAVAVAILTRAVASLRANEALLPIAAIALAANAGLDLALMHFFGLSGIALSTTAVQAVVAVLLGAAVFRRAGDTIQTNDGHGPAALTR